MLGTWLVCTFALDIWVAGLNRTVSQDVTVRCQVTEEFMRVGTPELMYTPLFVDCSKDMKVIHPEEPYGMYLVYKERDCE